MLRTTAVIGEGEDDNMGHVYRARGLSGSGLREAGIYQGDFENLCVTGGDQGSATRAGPRRARVISAREGNCGGAR